MKLIPLLGPLYRGVLFLSPPRSFAGVEREMTDVFLEACARAFRQAGFLALARAALAGMFDALHQASVEWRERLIPHRRGTLGSRNAPRRREIKGGGGTFRRDLTQAVRAARSTPGYALAVIGTLAIVIGANTAVFSVLESVLLAPLPYPTQGRLVLVHRSYPQFDLLRGPVSYPDYVDWRGEDLGLQDLGAYSSEYYTYQGVEGAERWTAAEVTTNLLPLLGVNPTVGSPFAQTADGLGLAHEVLLSHDRWTRSFGADPNIVGRSVQLDGVGRTVIGVMPRGFMFPDSETDFWTALPNHSYMSRRGTGFLTAVGLLRPDVSAEAVATRLASVAERIDEEHGAGRAGVNVATLRDAIVGDVRPLVFIAMGAALFVFAIACANLTNLSHARGLSREREFAVRSALGARRGELVKQLTFESLFLSVSGGVIGALLANALTGVFVALAPAGVPRLREIDVNVWALLFTFTISVLGGVLIGVLPARRAMSVDPADAMRGSSRATADRTNRRIQKGLVVAQVALTAVLLTGASLLVVSLVRLSSVDPGIRHENVLSMRVALEAERYDEGDARVAFHDQLLERVRAVPGVDAAAITTSLPFTSSDIFLQVTVEGATELDDELPTPQLAAVDAAYLPMLGIHLTRGRMFGDAERAGEPVNAIVNETMARVYWPNQDPLGQRFSIDATWPNPWITVVGVVRDNRQYELSETPGPMYYLDRRQSSMTRDAFLVVHGTRSVLPLTPTIRGIVAELDPNAPVSEINALSSLISRTLSQPRFRAFLLASLAVMALTIAAVGVYAVLAFLVGERRREIGVRLALGAKRNSVFLTIAGEGALLVVIGLAIGAFVAFNVSRVLDAMLFEVSARDPVTLVATNVFLVVVGFLACAGPALRASRVDPGVALRV